MCSNFGHMSVLIAVQSQWSSAIATLVRKTDAGWSGRQAFGRPGFPVRKEDSSLFSKAMCLINLTLAKICADWVCTMPGLPVG